MQKLLLLGDEAIAQGAMDAGLSCIYAYPGTPSTEITEYVHSSKEHKAGKVKAFWAANEKTAMEAALGVSYTGKRAMVCMKHVGLNVAADPFINSSITGANGGMIVTSADDPSMHSSQNEQDSRFFGNFAMIPVLEPLNQQEAYDMAHYGFDLSEKYNIPVLMRITTRLAHSRAGVERREPRQQNEIKLHSNLRQFVLLPSIARKQYKDLLGKQKPFEEESEKSPFNIYYEGEDKSLGIIASGISYNYLMEHFGDGSLKHPVLKIGQYPLPRKQIEKLTKECKEILVIEEGYPLIEEQLRGYLNNSLKVHGRLDGTLPRDGELNPNLVGKALGINIPEGKPIPEFVAQRPPQLCAGCPHTVAFTALNEAIYELAKGRVFSDIGCYTLGALKPYESINSCVDMGASITMAKGAADAGFQPSVAVIGDSTFTHSGITGLLDAVNDKTPITVLILDNATTAMTGGQPSAATGKIENICRGLGVEEEHIHIIDPRAKNHDEIVKLMKAELDYRGVSVIIPRRPCIVQLAKQTKMDKINKKEE